MEKIIKWVQRHYYKLKVYLHPKHPGCMDIPDPRDFIASSPVLKRKLPRKTDNLERAEKIGFKRVKQSKNACTAYSVINGAGITNTLETGTAVNLNAESQWAHQLLTGGSKEDGDTLQNANKQFYDHPQGYPETGYERIDHPNKNLTEAQIIDETKRWLVLKRTIRTGMFWRGTNYFQMKREGIFVRGEGRIDGGHAFKITDFDDDRGCGQFGTGAFRAYESELIQWGDEIGEFWIPYSNRKYLMSMYIPYDAKST